jgi:hypothetical protein
MPIEKNTFYQISKDEKDYVTELEKIGPDGDLEKAYHPGPFVIIDRHGRTCTPHHSLKYILTGGQNSSQAVPDPIIAPWSKTSSVKPNPANGLTMLPPQNSVDFKKAPSTSYSSSHRPRSRSGNGSMGNKRAIYPWEQHHALHDGQTSHHPESEGGSSGGSVRVRW